MLSSVTKINDFIAVSHGPLYKPRSNVRDVLYNRFQLGVLHTNGSTDVKTLKVSRNNSLR